MKPPSLPPDLPIPIRRWIDEMQKLAEASGLRSEMRLGQQLGVDPETVRGYLHGEQLPDRDHLAKFIELAKAAGAAPDESALDRAYGQAERAFADWHSSHTSSAPSATVSSEELHRNRTADNSSSREGNHPVVSLDTQKFAAATRTDDSSESQSAIRDLENHGLSTKVLRTLRRRDVLLTFGGVLGGLAGAWVLAPMQEVRGERAIQEDQRAQAAANAPLQVTLAERYREYDAIGWAFSAPLTAAQERRLLSTFDVFNSEWLAKEGGVIIAESPRLVDTTFSRLRLTIKSRWISPIIVTEIRARVRRLPPLSGALVWLGAEGDAEVIELGFDLDEDDCVARVRQEDLTLGAPYTDHHAITMNPGEIVPLDVLAQTAHYYCEWKIEFTVQVDGKEQKLLADNGGSPLRTTTFAERYQARYFLNRQWLADGQPASYWYSAGAGGRLR